MSELPEGWEVVKLSDILSIQYGKSPKEILETNGNYNIIGTGGIVGKTNKVLSKKPAVVIGRKGTIDKPQLLLEPFWAIDTTFYCQTLDDSVYIVWFYYLSKTLNLRKYNEASGVPSLSRDTLYTIKILTPPLPEQRKIAQILSTWDKAIATTEKQIANSKQQKKALMQQLLTGKKRLAGFSGDWEVVKLGDVCNYIKGYTYKSNEYSEKITPYAFLTLKSFLRGGGYNPNGIKYLINEVDDKFSVFNGDLIFAITDLTRNAEVVGAPILIPNLKFERSYISMDIIKLEVEEHIDKAFLFYLLQIRENRNFMRARASGSTVLHLDIKGSKNLTLSIPKTIKEQQKIAQVLTTADKEISALETQLAHLQQEKKALMQQLLTGKRRVVVEES